MISPLKPEDHFIAVGDWNVERQSDNPGAAPLNELIKTFHLPQSAFGKTYESQFYGPNPFQLQLDYVLVSSGVKGKIS